MANIPDDELYHQYELLREQQYEPLPEDLPRVGGPVVAELPDIVTSFDEPVGGRPMPDPSDQLGTYPDQAIDPEAGNFADLIRSASDLSAEPEFPAYEPAAELPESTGPRSARDLGDENVDEVNNAIADVAGIKRALRELEQDMGGSGEEESAPAKEVNPDLKDSNGSLSNLVSEESRWGDYQGERLPYAAISSGLRGMASILNPRQYSSDWLAGRNQDARRQMRGDFDYERQLRNEGRNEAQEDEDRFVQNQDRARRVASEDEVLARRRTLQGREDEVYSQSQEERTEARTVSSEPNVRYRNAVSELLGDVGLSPEEAAEYTQDLRVGDTERQAVINSVVEMRNQGRRDEAAAAARAALEAQRQRRGRGGSGPRRAITPGADADPTQLNRLVEARRGTFRSLQGRDPNDEEDAEIVRRAQLSLAGGDDVADRQLLSRAETTEELPDVVRQRLSGRFSDEEMAKGQLALESAMQAWESLPDDESRRLVLTSLDPAAQGIFSQMGVRVIGAARAGRTRTDAEIAIANTIRNYLNLKLKDLSGGAVTFSEAIRSGQATGAEALSPNPESLSNVLQQDAQAAGIQRNRRPSPSAAGAAVGTIERVGNGYRIRSASGWRPLTQQQYDSLPESVRSGGAR